MEGSRARAGGLSSPNKANRPGQQGTLVRDRKYRTISMVGMVCITQGASIPMGILASGEAGACQFLSFDVPMLVHLIPGGDPRSAVIPSKPYFWSALHRTFCLRCLQGQLEQNLLGTQHTRSDPKANDSSDTKPRSTTPVLSLLSAWLCFRGLQR